MAHSLVVALHLVLYLIFDLCFFVAESVKCQSEGFGAAGPPLISLQKESLFWDWFTGFYSKCRL